MKKDVLVIGAGIGGLCTALSLSSTGRAITLLDRDPEPPGDDPDAVFNDWHRAGAGHVRQSHAFLARLRNIIKSSHPGLLDDLKAAGVRELSLDSMLTDLQRPTYRPLPQDEELTIVTSRRTTLELVMRRYVETLDNVTIRSGFFVRSLIMDKATGGTVEVRGVCGEQDGEPCEIQAAVIIDASGKSGFTIAQLVEAGADIEEESETAGILYFTRHYRLKPGMDEPSRTENPPASGDLGYLKFGVFPGDNGYFSITIAVPEIEHELRKAIVRPDMFHAITLLLPGLEPWTNADRSIPRGKVYGMGNLHSRWRNMVRDTKPAVRHYFALGDTLVRTNPLYGRGCSFAAVSAQALHDVLTASNDPDQQQRDYQAALHRELRPFYDVQLSQDRSAIRRAHRILDPGLKRSFKGKLAESFLDDGVRIALRYDVDLLREALRGFHMLEHPNKWLGRPGNLSKVLYYWARGRRRNAPAYPPNPGPDRTDMMQALCLDHEADKARAPELVSRAA